MKAFLTEVEDVNHRLHPQCVVQRHQNHGVGVAGHLRDDPLLPAEGDNTAQLDSPLHKFIKRGKNGFMHITVFCSAIHLSFTKQKLCSKQTALEIEKKKKNFLLHQTSQPLIVPVNTETTERLAWRIYLIKLHLVLNMNKRKKLSTEDEKRNHHKKY